jgi:hypothetical protein
VALDLASPSAAILGGVAITLLITAVSAIAESRPVPRITPTPPALADGSPSQPS